MLLFQNDATDNFNPDPLPKRRQSSYCPHFSFLQLKLFSFPSYLKNIQKRTIAAIMEPCSGPSWVKFKVYLIDKLIKQAAGWHGLSLFLTPSILINASLGKKKRNYFIKFYVLQLSFLTSVYNFKPVFSSELKF